jgi:cobalt-zinc-cadmium efflux system outer membrane protein
MARRYTLSQELPFPGRTWARGRVASHQAEAMRADAEMAVQSRLAEARSAYYALAGAQRALGGLDRVDEANHEMAALSAKRGSFGQLDRMGQFMDAMLAMEAADVDSMRPMLQQELRAAKARLATLMGLEDGGELGAPELDLDAWLAEAPPTRAALLDALAARNPQLQAAKAQLKAAEAGRALAWSGWLPDLMLEGGLNEDNSGRQESSAMLTLSLPWVWGWGQAGAASAASARLEAARADLAAQRLRQREAALTALDELQAVTESLRITWTQVYPKARRGLELARSGFRTTALGPSEILMAVTDYRMTEEKLGRLIAMRGQALAMLEMLSAGGLDASAKEKP